MDSSIEIRKIGITKLDVDCIVNAANSSLRHGGGVCGAIFSEAGPREMQEACDRYGHCNTGSAVITPGFQLKARHVIHAVGPIWCGGNANEPEQLASCYQKSMELAMNNGCHSIAFPLISSGIFGYPKEAAWEVAIQSILNFQEQHSDYRLDVIIAVLDEAVKAMGEQVLQRLSK